MPHLPQSPQQTHSAPLLPEPVRTSGGCTYLKEGGGWAGAVAAATVNGTHSFSRGQAGEEEQWRRRHSQDTRASACLRQIDLQQTVESSCCKKNVISCSPSARDACVQKDAHSVAVIETRDNLHEVAPLSLSSSAAAATTGPTAYEMALAKYERKLLRMTQKQQLVEGKHRQEVLSRRRAVNEKYSELSRLQTATGSARRATVNHRDGSAPRRRHGDDGVGSPSTAPRKVTAVDAAARNDTPRACTLDGALEAVGHTSPSPAAHLSNAVSRKRKGGKTEYGVGGVTASWGEVPENKIDVEPTGGVGGKGCSWGDPNAAAQQRTVKDIRCPEGFLPTATPLAAPSLFCGKAVMADEVMVAGGDTFDGLCFTARPWRTPPRPLRRLCSQGPSPPSPPTFSFYGDARRSTRVLLHEPYDGHSVLRESGRQTSSVLDPHFCRRGRRGSPGAPRGESPQALVFIRPQRQPRPLPRHGEAAPRSDDELWGVREASFRGRAWSGDDVVCGATVRNYNRGKSDEKRRCTFTNVVPQYVLDGFAQRLVLRVAWRRWQKRLQQKRMLQPLQLDDAVLSSGCGTKDRWAELEAWLRDAAPIPSSLPLPLPLPPFVSAESDAHRENGVENK